MRIGGGLPCTRMLVLVAGVQLAWASMPRAAAAEEPDYRQAIAAGVAEFSAGNWKEALAAFRRAHRLDPNARTLRGIGMSAFELARYSDAVESLAASLQDKRSPLTSRQRRQVEKLLARAQSNVGSYQITLEPRDSLVFVDNEQVAPDSAGVLLLNVGSHEVKATADGFEPEVQRVTVEGGDQKTLHFALKPAEHAVEEEVPVNDNEPPTALAGRLWTWVALGTSAASLTAGIALQLSGSSAFDELDAECANTCTRAEIDERGSGIGTKYAIANTMFVLSAAAFVGAGVLYVLETPVDSSQAPGLSLRMGPTAATLTGVF